MTTSLVVTAIALLGGCGGSGDDSPGDAATSPSPAATTSPASTAATTTPEAPLRPGRVEAGRQAFVSLPCSGCHAGAGTRAAFGPRLAGQGLSKAVIRRVIENGRGQMPAGLASGQELEDIVAYLASLQR